MNKAEDKRQHSILRRIARRLMLERGLLPFFSEEALLELEKIHKPQLLIEATTHDLRGLCWCSIDNDDSLDIDQLTYAERINRDEVKVLVAIADVDEIVKPQSEIDKHAQHNTLSVYTPAEIFPMLPELLSNDMTSLNLNVDRKAIVVEMIIKEDGSISQSDIYSALVRNNAKLCYNSIASWLEGKSTIPDDIQEVKNLESSLRLQDKVAHEMKTLRHENGALDLNIIKAHVVFDKYKIKYLEIETTNRAKDIIADFMIGANGVVARYLVSKEYPSIRRVVRKPRRWDRIKELASSWDVILPDIPNPQALNQFLLKVKTTDPDRYPDISLSIVKLLGSGEYVVEQKGDDFLGHFGLAVHDYTHSTAPNRRFPDLITQRLLKAALEDDPAPYCLEGLKELAKHCAMREDTVKKIERQVDKSAAAMLLETRIGESFNGIVTGASEKGTWVRLNKPLVEGRLIKGQEKMDVGDKIQVELIGTNVERGFIDFKKEIKDS